MFKSLYVFLSGVKLSCVTVYLSNSNTDSDFDSPSLEREREHYMKMIPCCLINTNFIPIV